METEQNNIFFKKIVPFSLVVLSFVIFQPLCFLLMWFDKTYHKYLRIFLFIFGIALILLSSYSLITINKLSRFYADYFSVQQALVFPYAIILLLVCLGFIQVVLSFFFKRLPDIKIALASIFLVLTSLAFYVLIGVLVLSIVTPLDNMQKLQYDSIVNEKTGCVADGDCLRCLKKGIDLTRSCYNQDECESECKKILNTACQIDSDCNDGKEATIDICENPMSDKASCVNLSAECINLSSNKKETIPEKRLSIVFIPDKLDTSQFDNFQNELKPHVDAILSTEPFNLYKDRIKFYFLRVSRNFGYFDGKDPGKKEVELLVENFCKNTKEIIVMLGKGSLGKSAISGGLGDHFAISSIDNPWTTVHEFGHSFGGLQDNYLGWVLYDGNERLMDTMAPNVDVAGCQKWCQSNSGPYETSCTKIASEIECRRHERTMEYVENQPKWSCNDPYKCCVWLSEPDPFFQTRFINFRDDKNIGINCYKNSGCYFGSNGQGAWRSTLDHGIMTDEQQKTLEFEDVSKRALEEKLKAY